MKKATYSVVLTPGVKEALKIAAEKDRRSLSSFLEKIIIDYLDREGISWADKGNAPAKVGRPKKPAQKKQAT
jgi:predicted transcriptional regulator